MSDAQKKKADLYNKSLGAKNESMLKNNEPQHILDAYMIHCQTVDSWVDSVKFIQEFNGPEWFKKIAIDYAI